MLCRKYYIEFARLLARNKHDSGDNIVQDFADYFKRDNPAFNEEAFFNAVDNNYNLVSK